MKKAIDRNLLLDLCYGDEEPDCGWSLVQKEMTGTWRWGTEHEMVVRFEEDQSLWGFSYRTSDGDESRNHIRDEPELVELYPVIGVTVEVTQYVYDKERGHE